MKKNPKTTGETIKKVKKIKNDNKKDKKIKKPLTGYQMFAKDARIKVIESNPNAGFGEINHIIGQLWRECQQTEKDKYIQMAADAKAKLFETLTDNEIASIQKNHSKKNKIDSEQVLLDAET